MGSAYADLNKGKEASAFFRKAIALTPDNTIVHFLLALIHGSKAQGEHIKELVGLLEKYPNGNFDRARLCMSLGNVYHKQKKYEDAFKHYQEGNSILRACFQYSIEQDKVKIESIRACSNDESLFRDYTPPSFDTRPIFIVGMPRSGTSLLEQMLASHPDIETAGKRFTLKKCRSVKA